MKSTPENRVKKNLVEMLDELQVFHWPAAASPYGVAGVPDRLAVVCGRIIGIECKAPGKKPTALQAQFAARLIAAGGLWWLADGDDSLTELRHLIEDLRRLYR